MKISELYYNLRTSFDHPMGYGLGEKEPKLSKLERYSAFAAVDTLYPVVGTDVSSWQGNIDWPKLSTKVYFAYIRAGRGNDYRDSYYEKNILGARQTGRAYGLYWYMIPRSASNFKQHVDLMVNVWKDSGSQLPPMMDFEETPFAKDGTSNWIIKAINRFVEQTDFYPAIYTSAGWWNSHTSRMDQPKSCLLNVAHWTTAENPLIPNDWGAINQPKTWTFWQNTSSLVGKDYGVSSTKLDGEKYHYSLVTFNKTFKTNLLPLDQIPPPPPSNEVYIARVNTTALNIRELADANSKDMGSLVLNSEIPVYEESGDWAFTKGWVNRNYLTKL